MSNYSNLINEFIASLTIPKRPANLYDPIRYTLAQGGKRLRPELCLIACHTLGGNPKQALYPAVALELLHNFTLIHDDIMDQSELRRGQESVYKKWGANTAILAGDTLLGMAYDLMLKYSTIGSNKCYSLMTTTFIQICEGQQMDMDFERRKVVPVEEYLEMIRLKTSVLLGACMKAGAISAHASPEIQNAFYDFGIHIGLAFQIQDDLLDVYSQTEKLGKTIGDDIADNKKTYLSTKAMELLQGEELAALKHYFTKIDFKRQEKFEGVKQLYESCHVKEAATEQVKAYYEKAFHILETLKLKPEQTTELHEFTKRLMYREF
ncbi:MAG: polyprenyl synthetase family protein [Bacteroidales bacterium]|nr:polyprenyl synthetase family protein [Bacteroidales bacterium]